MPDFNLLRRLVRGPYVLLQKLLRRHPGLRFIEETRSSAVPISYDMWFRQQILGWNKGPYWPVHVSSSVTQWRNILIGIDVSPGYMPGCYIQAIGTIEIGDYTRISANVGIISANHDVHNLAEHRPSKIVIGRYCWLSMGCIVLPNVTLGDFTIVGAGAVVTKSFPQGYCVIAGNPAQVIRELDPDKCVRYRNEHEYHGYIRHADFERFRKENLNV